MSWLLVVIDVPVLQSGGEDPLETRRSGPSSRCMLGAAAGSCGGAVRSVPVCIYVDGRSASWCGSCGSTVRSVPVCIYVD
jgi:hypothetical protein